VIVCTIVARNYLAHARVLGRSFAEHHPGRRLRVLVVDGEVGQPLDVADEPFDVMLPSELPLDRREFAVMAAIYDATELATAVKPAFLLRLLEDSDVACYLDPDVETFATLDELEPLALEHGIVLTPHALEPIPNDGLKPTPDDIAAAGVFNLGFICVSRAARPFLEWWDARLRRDCLIDFDEGLFVDQRLLDFIPAYFEHFVLKDNAYNVAYWNLHERDISSADGRYEVDGRPLRFFHFSGYNPGLPDVLSKHGGDRPRILLPEWPVVAELCERYRGRLLDEAYAWQIVLPYGFAAAASGRPLDRRLRRQYRDVVLAGGEPPDPFATKDPWAFEAWRQGLSEGAEPLPARLRAQALLDAGNEVTSPRPWLRPLHAAIGRLLRHHDLHRRQVDAALLESVIELEERVRRLGRRLDA
jgi:hypothetical protein